MHRKIISVILLSLLVIGNVSLQVVDSEDITTKELHSHVAFLASDSLKGRKPGTTEGRVAAEYIKDEIRKDGLVLMGEDGFQVFEVVTSVKAGENNRLSFDGFDGMQGEDFVPVSFSGNGTVTASVVFTGYGFDFDDDDLSWHDYEGVDVAGKWAMVLRGDPEVDKSDSPFITYSSLRKKALVARDRGAVGVLFVSGEKFDKDDALINLVYDHSPTGVGIPVLHIKRNAANLMMKESGQTIEALEERLNKSRKPESFVIPNNIITASTEVIKNKAKTQNVVGLLKGSDPAMENGFIVLGAHYDHLGMGGRGSGSRRPDTLAVHNGADDNASGVAAILEIVENLSTRKDVLKRSILFIAFGAEEMGTLGSKYFTDQPLVDLGSVSAMLNLDMVGRLDAETRALSVSGSGTAAGLSEIVTERADAHGLKVNLSPEGYGPSDHAAFYAKDIPVLSFMTSIHEDYHSPDDDIEKLNFEGLVSVAEFVHALVVDLSNRTEELTFQEAGPKTRASARRRFKVTLGIMPDIAASDVQGVRATAVIPGRPASLAGMQKGDVIVAMEGKRVNDIYEYMHRLSEFKPGQRISVDVLRDGRKVILIVEL